MTKRRSDHSQRRAPRRKLFHGADLRDVAGAQRVHLLDLSTTGGQVHVARPPAPGTIVTLTCERFSRPARVAWVDGRRVGLAFVPPLEDADVAAVLPPVG